MVNRETQIKQPPTASAVFTLLMQVNRPHPLRIDSSIRDILLETISADDVYPDVRCTAQP